MGQVCSGSGVSKNVHVARDPDDKELDAIEMKETKIADFDAFFERAATPLNQLVDLHNSILQSEENLKSAASAIQGEAQVRLMVAASGRVDMVVWNYDEKENEHLLSSAELDDKLAASIDLRDAFERTRTAIDLLHASLEQPSNTAPSQYRVKRGRLLVDQTGAQDAFVRDVNVAAFTFRKHLMTLSHVSRLGEGVKIFLKELAKVQDVGSLSVAQNEETGAFQITSNGQPLDLKKIDKLSKPATVLRDALVELMDNVQTAATALPELTTQTGEFLDEAQALPSKIPDAVSSSELGLSDIPNATSATSSNVTALGAAPKIASATTQMMMYAGREVKEAVSVPLGA